MTYHIKVKWQLLLRLRSALRAESELRFPMICSIIVPVYNESENVRALHAALAAMAGEEPLIDWEFVFIEDGSTDNTFQMLCSLNADDPRVKVVRLSRNYGSHTGVAAGLRFVSGDACVIMAGDLQDHPREIHRFLAKWREGFHVVWGVRGSRQDSRLSILLAKLFSIFIRKVALPNYPPAGTGSFCLLDRKVIDALNTFQERNRMTFGLILTAGFRQTQIEYDRLKRNLGVSKWSFTRKINLIVDIIVSFSAWPIRTASFLGLTISMLSILYGAFLAIGYMKYGQAVEGWTTIVVLISMLGGVQLFLLGMFGEYLWRVCDEVRGRPLFVVQEVTGTFPRLATDGNGAARGTVTARAAQSIVLAPHVR
jgi:glycosyltransferase involved in cell wall biosynthesis